MSYTDTEATAAGAWRAGRGHDTGPSSAATTGSTATAAPTAPNGSDAPRRESASAGWQADPYTHALINGAGPLFLSGPDGERLPLGVERWCGTPDSADRTVIERCEGAVLDIGCGPGRFVTALARAGRRTLGIDVNPAAVHRTLRGGGPALLRSVFDPVPREGRWNTALLVDGNIGIGGDPVALLARTAEVLAPGGVLVAEVAAGDVDERLDVRFATGHRRADGEESFPWARLGTRALLHHADLADDWAGRRIWRRGGRCFVALRRREAPPGRTRAN